MQSAVPTTSQNFVQQNAKKNAQWQEKMEKVSFFEMKLVLLKMFLRRRRRQF